MTTAGKQHKVKASEIQLSGHPFFRRHHLLQNLSAENIKLYLYFRAQRETPFAFYGKSTLLYFKQNKYKIIHFNAKCVLECTILCTQCIKCVLESTVDKFGPKLKKSYKPQNTIQSCTRFNSVTQSCPTLCDPMNHSTPGLPVHHQLPESTQTQVHWVSDAIQQSHPLSSPSPPALNLS